MHAISEIVLDFDWRPYIIQSVDAARLVSQKKIKIAYISNPIKRFGTPVGWTQTINTRLNKLNTLVSTEQETCSKRRAKSDYTHVYMKTDDYAWRYDNRSTLRTWYKRWLSTLDHTHTTFTHTHRKTQFPERIWNKWNRFTNTSKMYVWRMTC